MADLNLSGSLLEQDRREVRLDQPCVGGVKPLEDVIEKARDEIAAAFAKKRGKFVAVGR